MVRSVQADVQQVVQVVLQLFYSDAQIFYCDQTLRTVWESRQLPFLLFFALLLNASWC